MVLFCYRSIHPSIYKASSFLGLTIYSSFLIIPVELISLEIQIYLTIIILPSGSVLDFNSECQTLLKDPKGDNNVACKQPDTSTPESNSLTVDDDNQEKVDQLKSNYILFYWHPSGSFFYLHESQDLSLFPNTDTHRLGHVTCGVCMGMPR